VDPGTSSGAALRSSLAASGGVMGALGNLGGGGGRAAGGAAVAASGGVAASGAAAQLAGDRTQGESTADAATSGRFAGALRAVSTGTSTAGRLAAGVAASAADVLSGAGIGHTAPYYGQSVRGRAPAAGNGHARATSSSRQPGGSPRLDEDGPDALMPDPLWSSVADDGAAAAGWPAERANGAARGGDAKSDSPAPRGRGDSHADDGAA
jgi:type IV secretion system protein TrbL